MKEKNEKYIKESRTYNEYAFIYLLDVNVWSHQSALQRNAFKSSAVRPTMTTGGATIVRTSKPMPTHKHMMPKRFNNVASVILTAFADRTRNTTDILVSKKIWKKIEGKLKIIETIIK